MLKYRNKKIETLDGVFDSKKEYNHWCKLKLMENSGLISKLERQVSFQLIPTIRTTEETLRMTVYKADFFYYDNEMKSYVVCDTKGYPTPDYILKKKLMLWLYPQYVFIEVGKKLKTYKSTMGAK